MSDGKESDNGKWWEFYFVRYFVGTVTGMGLVAFLNFDSHSKLNGIILPNLTDISKIDFGHATVLGAIGLAFCYVSSAPILTLHAYRGIFTSKWSDASCFGEKIKFWKVQAALLILTVIMLILLNIEAESVLFPSAGNEIFPTLSMAALSLVFGLQIFLILSSLLSKRPYIYFYYNKLAKERTKKNDPSLPHKEYIESYKHLREHGNAFFILIFEIVFTLTLYSVENPMYSLIILLVWISPSCCIWGLGTYLEMRLSRLRKNV